MSSINRYLASKTDADGKAEITLRISASRSFRIRMATGLKIKPDSFRDGKFKKLRLASAEAMEIAQVETSLLRIESAIVSYLASAKNPTREELEAAAGLRDEKPSHRQDCTEFFSLWLKFLDARNIAKHTRQAYLCVVRALHRYEAWQIAEKKMSKSLSISMCDVSMISSFMDFYRNEWREWKKHPEVYQQYPSAYRNMRPKIKPERRGNNSEADVVKRLRAFFHWCVGEGLLISNPIAKYEGTKTAVYGTPYYLTKEERNAIASFDFSSNPRLDQQRDVFVFQCLVGCRVSDMYSLTQNNIVDGAVEYIPGKTSKERLDTIRVPLSIGAKAILDKYASLPTLLPLVSQQKYNIAIKEVCRACGIDRIVTVVNPTTGETEQKHLWEVASSHMARRTFIGTLYKQVKDPNLIGALSGHKEGSKAFARYREIDEDLRQELVSLLD